MITSHSSDPTSKISPILIPSMLLIGKFWYSLLVEVPVHVVVPLPVSIV